MVLGGVTWFFGGITWFFGGSHGFWGDHMVFGGDHMVFGGITWFLGGSHGFWGDHMFFLGNGRRISHRQIYYINKMITKIDWIIVILQSHTGDHVTQPDSYNPQPLPHKRETNDQSLME